MFSHRKKIPLLKSTVCYHDPVPFSCIFAIAESSGRQMPRTGAPFTIIDD